MSPYHWQINRLCLYEIPYFTLIYYVCFIYSRTDNKQTWLSMCQGDVPMCNMAIISDS